MDDVKLICTLQHMAWLIREVSEGRKPDGLGLKRMDTNISELAKQVPTPRRREDYDPPPCPGRIGG